MRARAILYCLKFGVLPWWWYENKPHFDCSYWQHLVINMRYAWRWASGRHTFSDIRFELETNGGK